MGCKKGNIPWNKGLKTGIKPWLGKKRSLKDRLKMSEGQKKRTNWRKGFKLSDETKEKIRKTNTGKKQSDNTKLKRSLSLKGRKNGSPNNEIREKIKNTLKLYFSNPENRKKK